MRRVPRIVLALLAPLVAVQACATSRTHSINNVCAVFSQHDGWFGSWRDAAEQAERKHGVPAAVLMATVRKESGFKGNARPPRTKLLGVIPWKRQSSAYGFSQALDGTWEQYERETGRWAARRGDFSDAIDFVGWYHAKTVADLGVAKDDAFNLYLAYYLGWGGYRKGLWQNNASLQAYARQTAEMAENYEAQMRGCSG